MPLSEWRRVPIGQLGTVITGRTPPAAHPEYFGDSIPFITPSDMVGFRKVTRPARGLSEEGAKALKRVLVQRAVAVSCIGWQMGKVILVDGPSATNQQINTIIVDEGKADRYFLYYALRQKRAELFRLASGGSRTPILNKSQFERVLIDLPTLTEQRAIATVLAALDDKIELNREANETLEATARTIFKSWFVDFDPVHAKAEGSKPCGMEIGNAALFPNSLQDSSLGKIPKGWTIRKVRDLIELSHETLNPSQFPEEVFHHYSIPAFDEQRWPAEEKGDDIKSNKIIAPPDVILLSKLNPRIPRVWMPQVSGVRRSIASTEFLAATAKRGLSREFVYALFTSQSFLEVFTTLVTGTSGSHQRVKPEFLLEMDLIIPPTTCMDSFVQIAGPLYSRVIHNLTESRTLAAIRNALLPKLVSGEIRVGARGESMAKL